MSTNLLISGLPFEEQSRLRPFFERISLQDGEMLVRAGQPIGFMYFAEDAVVLTAQDGRNGARIPAGLTGVDGVAGFELALGRSVSPLTSVAEVGGEALRMRASHLQSEVLETDCALKQALSEYLFHFVSMGVQMAVCLQAHAPEERLCRWLQMIHLRAPQRESYALSDSLLAALLSTEPNAAVLAVRVLEHAGLVEYQDQRLRILDKQGLMDGCCECSDLFHERLRRLQKSAGNA